MVFEAKGEERRGAGGRGDRGGWCIVVEVRSTELKFFLFPNYLLAEAVLCRSLLEARQHGHKGDAPMQSYDDEEYDYLYKGKPRQCGSTACRAAP